jgi:hypothetical protein
LPIVLLPVPSGPPYDGGEVVVLCSVVVVVVVELGMVLSSLAQPARARRPPAAMESRAY